MVYTYHARHRILGRMQGLITTKEIDRALLKVGKLPAGQFGVIVKRVPLQVVKDTDGSQSKGDRVIVVYEKAADDDWGRVVTVELRKSTQPSLPAWKGIIDLTV